MSEAAFKSPEEFGRIYLPHYFSVKSPPFHREISRLWSKKVHKVKKGEKGFNSRGSKIVLAAPRGHAKSTLISLMCALHAALMGYKKDIILISDTESQAVYFLDSIKHELTENEKILEDFGEQKGKIWKNNSVVLKNGCRIDAMGSGQKLRGRRHIDRRPDLIILDDIENDEDVRSAESRRKLASWYFSAVSKAGDYYTDIVFVGTVLHKDSLLANLLQNAAYVSKVYRAVESFSQSPLWEKWEKLYLNMADPDRESTADSFFKSHKKEMLEGTKVLWSEKMPYDSLMMMRLSEGEAAFSAEMQNTPSDRSDALFPKEWTGYYKDEDFKRDCFDFYGYCDPSLGKTASSDYSALITIAKNRETGVMYVENADIARRHPDAILEDILSHAERIKRLYGKKYRLYGAEVNQFQWFLKEQLSKESAKRGIYLPVCEVRTVSDKIMRVQSLQPYIKNKYVLFSEEQTTLLNQLWDFPSGAYDDGPDALEGCVSLCRKTETACLKGLVI